jgi:hypothetical protein
MHAIEAAGDLFVNRPSFIAIERGPGRIVASSSNDLSAVEPYDQ